MDMKKAEAAAKKKYPVETRTGRWGNFDLNEGKRRRYTVAYAHAAEDIKNELLEWAKSEYERSLGGEQEAFEAVIDKLNAL